MMTRITLILHDDEKQALIHLAQDERRSPREQAALLLRRKLQELGLILDPSSPPARRSSGEDDPPLEVFPTADAVAGIAQAGWTRTRTQ